MEKSNLFFEALFNREISAPGAKDFLATLAEEHPYFSPARFYLLRQTEKGTSEYKKQLSKTAVLFNNNYWLNFLLTEPAEDAVVQKAAQDIQASEYHETAGTIDTEDINTATEAEFVSQEDYTEQAIEEENVAAFTNEDITETIVSGIPEEEQCIEEENNDFEIEPLEEQNIESAGETGSEENEQGAEGAIVEELSAAPLLRIHTTAGTKEDTLIFEPLHTTDYFASVGIKLSEEVKPADKLGQQLKSFTEWLKTMKKVHSEPQIETTKETEQQIQQLAEKSNVNGDVITESMADVLLQQGRADKAVEMLEKLSLLNPSKIAYFAAKIKKIKES